MKSTSTVYDSLSPQQRTDFLGIFYGLQITGAFGLGLILITTAFSKSLKPRHPLLVNMLLCWFLFGLSNSLLLLSGYGSGLDIPFGLCLANAVILKGVKLATLLACFLLILHVWMVVLSSTLPEGRLKSLVSARTRIRTLVFLGLPYILLVSRAIILLFIVLDGTEAVGRRQEFFYCSIRLVPGTALTSLEDVTSIVMIVLFAISIVFEFFIGKAIWQQTIQIQSLNQRGLMCLRTGIFTGFTVSILLIVLVNFLFPVQMPGHPIFATLPLAVFLIFGPQHDVFMVWFGWVPCFSRYLVPTPEEFAKSTAPSLPASVPHPGSRWRKLAF